MKLPAVRSLIPGWKSLPLALLSAVLLILAFPDFEYWILAWFGLLPLLVALEWEHESPARSFVLGWLWGVVFFFGTCWWLAYAPIHYAAFPPPLAYFLLFCVTAVAAIFPGLFGLITSAFLKRFGAYGFLLAPFVWAATEFARYWLTGNNWNAIGYSQAFGFGPIQIAELGGLLLVSFSCIGSNSAMAYGLLVGTRKGWIEAFGVLFLIASIPVLLELNSLDEVLGKPSGAGSFPISALVIAIQPNVPMSGLNEWTWSKLRDKQIGSAQAEVLQIRNSEAVDPPMFVVLPESPMNFTYDEDPEFQRYIGDFARRNYVNVIFNSAEPDPENKKYFNSAVLVGTDGKEIIQYDKIYLLPFGESVPGPLQAIVPAFVGSFSYGKGYNMVPLGGDLNAGVMICFESHFGGHTREFARRGADVLIEMTNDGYLGPTPVLRQHLANAVFRAVETGRPVLRVTNVGITTYINEHGEVIDPAESYTEATRVWSVSKSDGHQTFYVRYGDWFAWLCMILTLGFLGYAIFTRKRPAQQD